MRAAALTESEESRVRLAVSCTDTADIPKVPDAGDVHTVDSQEVQVMHNGVVVARDCYYGPMMTEIIRQLRGHHEPQEEAAFHAALERIAADGSDGVMVELGSHWSYYSLWFLNNVPDGRAICVEPDPSNLAVGQRNFELNHRTAAFVHAAVGRDATAAEPFRCEDGIHRPVPTVSFDSLLATFDLDRIDMLLLDVQGAEHAFLEGAGPRLAERVRFVVVSTHHHSISGTHLTHELCLELLVKAGAHVFAEHSIAESFTGDGLIAASFDERDRDLAVPLSRARAKDSLFGDPLWELATAEYERGQLERQLAEVPGRSLRRSVGRLLRRRSPRA